MGNLFLFSEYQSIVNLNAVIHKCTKCQYGKHSKKVCGSGPGKAKLMVVGQHPGPKEVETGVPFSGSSGDLLKKIMTTCGINYKESFLTNVIKCKPMGEDKVAIQAIKACSEYLDNEIDLVGPKVILALGAIAADSLVSKDAEMGIPITGRYGIPIITTYHTAYLLRLKNASSNVSAPILTKDKYVQVAKEMKAHWDTVARLLKE